MRVASMPSIMGIRTSMSTTSGISLPEVAASASTASRPFSACATMRMPSAPLSISASPSLS